jgi:hypothetical protein
VTAGFVAAAGTTVWLMVSILKGTR